MGTCGGIGQPGHQVRNPLVLGVTLSMGNLQLLLEAGIGLPQGGQGSPAELPMSREMFSRDFPKPATTPLTMSAVLFFGIFLEFFGMSFELVLAGKS